MLRIYIREKGFGWRELPEGPFPITKEQLMEARSRFDEEFRKSPLLAGAKIAPQTAARDILTQMLPNMSSFDLLVLGFAVTAKQRNLRIEDE